MWCVKEQKELELEGSDKELHDEWKERELFLNFIGSIYRLGQMKVEQKLRPEGQILSETLHILDYPCPDSI